MTELQQNNDIADAASLVAEASAAARDHRYGEACDLFKRAMEIDGSLATGPHAYLAQLLNKGADLENVRFLAPARLNALVTTGWLTSVFTGRPENAKGQPIPWFTHPAIDFLEPKIKPHWTVLEWGCGNSTLWWASRVRRVVSIEHDRAWCQGIAAKAPSNVSVRLVEDLDRYANLDGIDSADTFDAIVIDGEERNLCARVANTRAKPGGIIIVDNSDRKSLRDGLAFLGDTGWKRIDFFGLLPSYAYRTCTSVFFRDDAFLNGGQLPCDIESSLGLTCAQVLNE